MPFAQVHGGRVRYEVLGEGSAWVVLTPGGRGPLESVALLGEELATAGWRVLLHDRRNCGASDLLLDGSVSEQKQWADDLHALLQQLGAAPVVAGGGSAGCRLSLLLALRHPGSVRGLLLWSVTGGPVAAQHLAHSYYGQYVEAARAGGMEAVAATEFFVERIAANPEARAQLLAVEPAAFIDTFSRWSRFFADAGDLPVIGATAAQLQSLSAPACVVPGGDDVHPHEVAANLVRLLTGAELHPFTEADLHAFGQLPDAEVQRFRQKRLGAVYAEFLLRHLKT